MELIHIMNEYPKITKQAIKYLMLFVSTFICERSVAYYTAMKTKYRNRSDVKSEICL